MAQVVAGARLARNSHQYADRCRSGVPDSDFLLLQNAVPAFCIEVAFVDEVGHPMHQRRDDAVGRSGHPTRVRRAPEHIFRMQIESELACHVMHQRRIVNVDRTFRHPGGSAGEV